MSPVSPSRAASQIACAAQIFQESDSDVDADAESGQSDDEQQRSVWASLDAEGFESFAPRAVGLLLDGERDADLAHWWCRRPAMMEALLPLAAALGPCEL